MRRHTGQFLRHLESERGASAHTIKGYREDLESLAEYLADEQGATPDPASITTLELRGYVSAMHDAGYAKTSISRKLSSIRSFFRYGQREQWVTKNLSRSTTRRGRVLGQDDRRRLRRAVQLSGADRDKRVQRACLIDAMSDQQHQQFTIWGLLSLTTCVSVLLGLCLALFGPELGRQVIAQVGMIFALGAIASLSVGIIQKLSRRRAKKEAAAAGRMIDDTDI